MFTRTDDFNAANDSSLQAYVKVSPTTLIGRFGEPDESDGYKVSMEWLFEGEDGNVVTLYDWKSTHLYDPCLPPADILRVSPLIHEFHVGSHNYETASNFVEWLLKEVG